MLNGLSQQQANDLLKLHGLNEIPEKKASFFTKIIFKFLSPISLMLLASSSLSLFMGKIFDFYFILLLLFLNIFISLWQEKKADNAIAKLNEHLAQRVRVLRDQKWTSLQSRLLVVGDLVELSAGEIVPADGALVDVNHAAFNEAALTGESLPKEKKVNERVFAGSFLVSGLATIKITATGKNTTFGKTVFSVERIRKKSILEQDILSIARFLTILSLLAVFILSIVFVWQKAKLTELLSLDLSLLIAGIPVSLPTVMTLIIEFGVLALAKKNVIVRRLSALEDLANVNFLLTDKTGTLTKNQITVKEIIKYGDFTQKEVLNFAFLTEAKNDFDPIYLAIKKRVEEEKVFSPNYQIMDFIPADSIRKRSTVLLKKNGQEYLISVGAAQVISSFCKVNQKFNRDVEMFAEKGYRSLAVAVAYGKKEENMFLAGLLALSDTLRPDAKEVINFLEQNSISCAMVTGDNRKIAGQIAGELFAKERKVVTKDELDQINWQGMDRDFYLRTSAFAEVLPEDKMRILEKAKDFFTVAGNGDGVNDLPALKAANVGIAVKNAVPALKGASDIVLLTDGISVIRDAILESRKIFSRLYTYSLYRISESLRFIVTICVLGILYKIYPLTPLQIIIIALLNDIPIISLASDRVKIMKRPAKINSKSRFFLSSLYGLSGIANSLLLFFFVYNILHFDWRVIQTMYFLKVTVSGHMLIYVAHTDERWYRFLPSREVIWATTLTQILATILALTGFLMPAKIPFAFVAFVWIWSFFWMQISEGAKLLNKAGK